MNFRNLFYCFNDIFLLEEMKDDFWQIVNKFREFKERSLSNINKSSQYNQELYSTT